MRSCSGAAAIRTVRSPLRRLADRGSAPRADAMPLLLDTGVIYALADRDDAWHERCVAYLKHTRELLLVPITVIPEAAYFIHERLGAAAERRFVRSIADRELTVESLRDADWQRIGELLDDYERIGVVDASVVAMAERLKLDTIATTDRRDFGTIRPKHRPAFRLVP
ncbi:MAG: VapC toxin family PIN domain ribonuclease [Acidobacteria bacterium]|nr:MAG: VapC toxin family PIN domain ribonuclease [Acidobacteriota bacterium]